MDDPSQREDFVFQLGRDANPFSGYPPWRPDSGLSSRELAGHLKDRKRKESGMTCVVAVTDGEGIGGCRNI